MKSFISLLSAAALVSASPILERANTTASAPTVCNGRAEYCSRIYSNVSQIASHDSAFVGELPQDNQLWSVADQLSNGVRFLTVQTHKDVLGSLDACHTSCFEEDAGPVSTYLSTVKTFLDNNPDEVVTVLLTNGDNLNMSAFDAVFTQANIKSYAYIPPTSPLAINAWPTLSDLITTGKRLVVFMDYGAGDPAYPYILDEFAYFFETPFDVTDPNFADCSVNRPPGASPTGRMYAINHNLDVDIFSILIPDRENIDNTNAATGNPSSIMNQTDRCVGLYSQYPKAVLLDYVDSGNWKQAELAMNGLS